ncbi:MAG: TonB-dependent receptor [Cyclobacteriaceae bacterium]|nr:TonB-dependent receptor [Cyclobacteriaceae bacterium]
MNRFYRKALLPLLFWLCGTATVMAQTTSISGTVKDGGSGETLAGVNIVVKGRVIGTISSTDGRYNLKVNQAPPFTLVFSFIGYATQEFEVTEATATIDVSLAEQTLLGQEVVVSASRFEESILKSPVTIEKMDIIGIRQSATPDFYDGLANMKGVQTNSGSLNFTAVNTRGFATIANTRFVQWVDGMDTQAPLLNFPTGSIIGLGELDAESMELVPGAASALYGPNAFNGILIMQSKSPFDYQGLSAQFKGGIVSSEAGGSHPLTSYSLRYAKAFNNKFAFKINGSIMQTTDWLGNDYKTDRNNPESTIDLSSKPNFDGLNLYGDETPIPVPIGGTFGTLDLRRTGYSEQAMLAAFDDNRDAKTLKLDGALHYRINDKLEAIYNYRFGGGSSIYQGTEKYALRDFTQQFNKIELKGSNFFIRAYRTATDAGKSYNMSALGGFANETIRPTAASWAPTYAQTYVLAMQGYVPGVPAGNPEAAHAAARANADTGRPAEGSTEFVNLMRQVRAQLFQGNPPGASFVDNSRLYHAEFNYRLFDKIKWAEIQFGGNLRQYSLFSNATVFNEAPNGGEAERIKINEYGAYTQIGKAIGKLKLTGSLRYDKNENFDGQLTPRLAGVFEIDPNNNLRASFQTGFRNPDTQAQFIYFPSSGGTLLGSTEANAARYGVHNGGAYTQASYNAYRASGGSIDGTTGALSGGNQSLLVTANLPYVQPEQLRSFEIGYKGLLGSNLLIDLNGYYTSYSNFIGGQIVVSKNATTHKGTQVNAGTLFSPYTNSTQNVTSTGIGLGLTYNLPKNFVLTGNYNWATFKADESPEFRAGFNTPENRFSVGIGNRKIAKNLGFNANFRWQQDYEWQSSFGIWQVPEFGVLDAQVNYKISSLKTIVKIGGTNLGGGDYRTNLGAPFVGQQYFISLTFDEFLK